MAEGGWQLRVSRAQLEQFNAHLFVYVWYLAVQASALPQPTLETAKDLGSRFLDLFCTGEETEFFLTLSAEEVWVLNDLFLMLRRQYSQSPSSQERSLALEHLSACRLLVRQAERPGEEYLSITEAAHIMSVSARTVYGYLGRGKLQGFRSGVSTVISAKAVQQYQRAAIGRPRTRLPVWRKPIPANQEYLTTITVRLRQGRSERLEPKLAEIRRGGKHLLPGTVARYIVRDDQKPYMLQIVLVWRKLVMPSDEEREAAVSALCADLAELLDGETIVKYEGQVLMNT
jgi:excisionase family DNA binding protein